MVAFSVAADEKKLIVYILGCLIVKTFDKFVESLPLGKVCIRFLVSAVSLVD